VVVPGRVENLTPFDSRRAIEAGKKSGQVRRNKKVARKVLNDGAALSLARLSATFKREDLGGTSAAMAQALMVGLADGVIEIDPKVVPDLIRVLVDVARLEAGQATSHTVRLGDAGVMARLEELRAQATTGGAEVPEIEGQ